MKITEFLLERIAEDEAVARGAGGESWEWKEHEPNSGAHYDYLGTPSDKRMVATFDQESYISGFSDNGGMPHVVRFHPARILAECAAKRLVIEEHPVDENGEFCYDDDTHLHGCKWAYPCPTIQGLLGVYADHGDYNPEWSDQ